MGFVRFYQIISGFDSLKMFQVVFLLVCYGLHKNLFYFSTYVVMFLGVCKQRFQPIYLF